MEGDTYTRSRLLTRGALEVGSFFVGAGELRTAVSGSQLGSRISKVKGLSQLTDWSALTKRAGQLTGNAFDQLRHLKEGRSFLYEALGQIKRENRLAAAIGTVRQDFSRHPARVHLGKVAEKADDVARVVDKVEDGVRLSEKTLDATARFDEHSIVNYTDKMTGKYTAKDVEVLTKLTTHNANSKTALLGYFEESSVRSYEQIAHVNGFTYFDSGSEGWKAMSKVAPNLAEKVNKEFLMKQIQAGKDIVLSSNPYEAIQKAKAGKGKSYAKELDILAKYGYKIESYGQFWRAYK